ncbi:MAG: beta-propeller domain-containing protein, partial [Aquihabitans sp.]
PSTGLHRFDLASLTHTGSGQVAGSMLNDFSLSEHDGFLRVAVTTSDGMIGRPVPMDGVIEEPGSVVEVPGTAMAPIPTKPMPDGSMPDEPMPVDPAPMPPVADPPAERASLNEVVVFDTVGDLDVVGRTAPFGHPGETLRGIRFDGDVGYGVTFLNTDPFYVLDLADPAAPRVQGEVELPGFSSYLHPISARYVVGFGPDESGRASAKLFDVSDRSQPRVVDSVVLGDESPVTFDHHAFVSLGTNRFAVPASDWTPQEGGCDLISCSPTPRCDPAACDSIGPSGTAGVRSSVVVLGVVNGRLVVEERHSAQLNEAASRVIPTTDGWGLLTSGAITLLDAAGNERVTLPLN